MRVTAHHLAWRLDCFCARLNNGLMAVAVVLFAVFVGATAGRELRALDAPPPVTIAPASPDVPIAWGP